MRLTTAIMLCLASAGALAQGVYTRSYDNARSGWNHHEAQLTQDYVIKKGIRLATVIPVIGDARGMEAQPLIMPNVKTDQGIKDVLLLPSMANMVRAVDAATGKSIWETSIGTPIQGGAAIDFDQINDKWGALSTGVIDPTTQRWYQVAWISPDASGSAKTARYYMNVINIADGSRVVPPVLIDGGDFNAAMRKARSSALLLVQEDARTVIQCTGSVFETGHGSSGFCFAFDTTTNRMTAMLPTTKGAGAGIWMAGQGVIGGPDGSLYALTGNGDFDGQTQFGESMIRMRYTPPEGDGAGKIEIVDHWTPWTDQQRSGARAPDGKMAGKSMPSEAIRPVGAGMSMPMKNAKVVNSVADGKIVPLVYPQMASGEWSDEDWGSSGPACLFQLQAPVCIAAGKDGIAYPINALHMGNTQPADLANPKANCAKLASPPVWLTMSPGPVDPCPADPKTLNFFPWGVTAHLHMTPVQMYDPLLKSWVIFAWGENSQLHKWTVGPTGKLTYIAQGHEYASAESRPHSPGGMPGGFCSGSSNGRNPDSMLLVCSIPYGDANATVTNGRLLIYDPVHLAADGSLKVLWDSEKWNIQFTYNKFMIPVIWHGRIYLPNYSGGVEVFQ